MVCKSDFPTIGELEHLQRILGVAPDTQHYPDADNGLMSYTEIAKALGISPQGVRMAERRALRKLRARLRIPDE
jgi:hypothetical protein